MNPTKKLSHLFGKAIYRIFITVAVTAVLVSCSSQKKAINQAPQQSVVMTETPSVELRQMIESYAPQWQRVKMPVNVSVLQPVSLGASGYLTMVRDQYVALSVRVLGMEVASLYLASDTVVVVDRWNKRYLSEGLSKFLAGFPVTINNVQDLLLGRIFIAGQNSVTASDASEFDFESDGAMWACRPKSLPDAFGYAFVALADKLVSLQVSAGKGGADVAFLEPVDSKCGSITSGVAVTSKAGSRDINIELVYNPKKAQWNDEVKTQSFSIPRGYTRVDASSVLKGLKIN